jgi:hypothetical protein
MLFGDLLESRAFRKESTMEKYSVDELGRILFLHFLALYAVRKEGGDSYANKTLAYPLFDGIYFSTTDLANLISTYKNSDRFLEEKAPTLPILEIKRILRNGASGNWSPYDCRAIFMKLQNVMKIRDTTLNKLRRDLVDDDTPRDRLIALRVLYREMQKTAYQSDLIDLVHNYLERIDDSAR